MFYVQLIPIAFSILYNCIYIIGISDNDELISQSYIVARFEELISLGIFYKS